MDWPSKWHAVGEIVVVRMMIEITKSTLMVRRIAKPFIAPPTKMTGPAERKISFVGMSGWAEVSG